MIAHTGAEYERHVVTDAINGDISIPAAMHALGILPLLPTRIRRCRLRGWRTPANTIYVGRPSRWGNPITLSMGRMMLINPDDREWERLAASAAVREFRRLLDLGMLRFSVDDVRRELRGKHLACWCALGQPCHADVLLEVANSGAP